MESLLSKLAAYNMALVYDKNSSFAMARQYSEDSKYLNCEYYKGRYEVLEEIILMLEKFILLEQKKGVSK